MIQKYLLFFIVCMLFIELSRAQFQRILVSSFSDTILIPCQSSDEAILISDLPSDIQNLPGIQLHSKANNFEQTNSKQDLSLDGNNIDFYFIKKVSDITDTNSIVCEMQDFSIDFTGLQNVFFTGIYYFEDSSTYELKEMIQLSQLENFIINNVSEVVDIQGFQIQPQDIQTTLIEITSADTLHINNFVIQGNEQSEDQALEIYFTEILSEITVSDLQIQNFSKGFLFEIAKSTNLVLEDMTINNNGEKITLLEDQLDVGIKINQSNVVTFNNLEFEDNYGFSLFIADGEYIDFNNSRFENNTNDFGPILAIQNCDYISVQDQSQFLNNKVGNSSAFNIENSTHILILDTQFDDNTGTNYGGSLNISFTENVTLSQLSFIGNKANYGSAIYMQYVSDLTINDCQATQNNALLYGGFLFLDNSENVNIFSNHFQLNQAKQGGSMFLRNSNYVSIIQNEFKDNIGTLTSGAIYAISMYNLYIDDCFFSSNSSGNTGGGAIYLYSSENMTISNSNFEENKSSSSGAAIMLVQSKNFTCDFSKFYKNTVEFGYGGAIRIDRENLQVIIKNSEFNYNSGMYGGAISLNTEIDTTIVQNCTFNNNTAQYQGGAMYLEYSSSLIQGSNFTQNYAYQGGCVFINFAPYTKFLNIVMDQNNARQVNGIYAKDSENLQIYNFNMTNQISTRLSNIYLKQVEKTLIKDSFFLNNFCNRNGGVLRIQSSGTLEINNSLFKNNSAGFQSDSDSSYTGGAIFMIESEKFILYKTIFTDNFATYKGGAISLSQVSDLQIDFSEFYNNYVSYNRQQERKDKIGDYNLSKGGSIYYETLYTEQQNQELTFSISISDCNFQNNSASSGSSVYIHQNITNSDYQIDFKKMKNVIIKNDMADVGFIRILADQQYNSDLFKGVKNDSSILYVGSDVVQQGYSVNEKSFFNDKLQFSLCPAGTYLAIGGASACKVCQDHGECDGGYGYYYPQDGYWRYNETTTSYVYCENFPENCLKNDTCKLGFSGVLCEQCDYNEGYFESVGGGCTLCSSQFVSIVYVLIAFLVFLVILALTVFVLQEKVRQNNYKKEIYVIWKKNIIYENNSASIAKIGLMHIQIIYLLDPENIEFPVAFSGISKYFSNPGNTVSVSFYCVNQVFGSMFKQSKIFQFASTTQIISLGILLGLLITIVLYNRKALKRKTNTVKYQLVCVFVIWFISQQAGILESSIQFLVCRDVGDIKYSLADINLKCDSPYYLNYVKPVNIAILLIFLVAIPCFMFYKMYRSRHSNQTIRNQCSYGYLYIDLKNDLYYWEYLSMFQKIAITIICQAFFKQFLLKYYFCLCVVIIYFIFCKLCYPYKSYKVNRFQLISSISLVSVIFSSIVMRYQDTDSELSAQLIKILCQALTFGTNILFFIYGVYIYYPNIQHKMLAYSLTYFKRCSGNYLKNHFEKQQKVHEKWKIVKDNFKNFQKVMRNEKYRNLNRAFLFFNINQKEMMEGIQKGDHKKLNEKVYESLESRIFSQNSVQLKKAKNYVDLLKSMNSMNNINSQGNQVHSNRSIRFMMQQSRQNDNFSIAVLEEELKSGESNNQRQYSDDEQQYYDEEDLSRSKHQKLKKKSQNEELNQSSEINDENNGNVEQKDSIQVDETDSDVMIPQETNKKLKYDDLDKKWQQFTSQMSNDQIQQIKQHEQQQFQQFMDNSSQRRNTTQQDQESQKQQFKFAFQTEPFENIFSNPGDRNQRNRQSNKFKLKQSFELNGFPQYTTENYINLLSLDSGTNFRDKIRENKIRDQIVYDSDQSNNSPVPKLQNSNFPKYGKKLSNNSPKNNNIISINAQNSNQISSSLSKNEKIQKKNSSDNNDSSNLEFQNQNDYKNENQYQKYNQDEIKSLVKKKSEQKSKKITKNIKTSVLSESSSQESSQQIPSEKISYFSSYGENSYNLENNPENKEQSITQENSNSNNFNNNKNINSNSNNQISNSNINTNQIINSNNNNKTRENSNNFLNIDIDLNNNRSPVQVIKMEIDGDQRKYN